MNLKTITALFFIVSISCMPPPSMAWHSGVTVSIINDIADNVDEFVASGFHTNSLIFNDKNFLNTNKHGRAMHSYHWSPKTATFMVGFKGPVPRLVNRCPMIDYCGHSTETSLDNVHYLCASSLWRVEHNTVIKLKMDNDYVLTCEREVSAFRTW